MRVPPESFGLPFLVKFGIKNSFFPVKLQFLWIGRTRDSLFVNIEDRYLKRVEKFFPTRRTMIPELKKSDPRARTAGMEQDAKQIRRRIGPKTYLVAVDPQGEELSSPELAGFLDRLIDRGVSETTFVVGGSRGLPAAIRDSAQTKLSLTRMTLPHRLARVLLLEQVYRAITISRGLPYHK